MINVASQLAAEPGVQVSLVSVTRTIKSPAVLNGIRVFPVAPAAEEVASYGFVRRKVEALSYYWRFARTLWAAAPDAYFGKLVSLESVITFAVSRLRRRSFCFRVEHDWETSPDSIREHILRGRPLTLRLFTSALKRADLVICQTIKQQQALAASYGLRAVIINNAHVIPPAVELAPSQRAQVLWIGRAHSMKRPMLFLEMARRLPELSFTMVMWLDPVYASLYEEVRTEAARLPNVHYSSGVPQAEVGQLYQAARVFVLTSDAEGFSNTLIEALKTGVPVLSYLLNFDGVLHPLGSRSGSAVPAEEKPAAVGFCAEGDFELLVALTQELCLDDALWSACSRKARDYAVQNFDVRSIAPVYIKMIRDLVSPT